jgi:hypothetical protein
MTTVEEGLVAHLMGDSDVTASISTRLYPLVVPQDAALPAAAYQRISGPREPAHDGPTGLARARIQFTFVGATYAEAKEAATAFRRLLDGHRRGLPGVKRAVITLVDDRDDWAPQFEKPVVRQDYMIWYTET